MNKNIPKTIFISIIIFVIVLTAVFFIFIYNKKQENTKVEDVKKVVGDTIMGKIEGKRIERDSQYLTIKDDAGKLWKINITNETVFKKMLNLNDGDNIKIIGKIISDKELNSLEIDSAK